LDLADVALRNANRTRIEHACLKRRTKKVPVPMAERAGRLQLRIAARLKERWAGLPLTEIPVGAECTFLRRRFAAWQNAEIRHTSIALMTAGFG
jgi:hypothetical protein